MKEYFSRRNKQEEITREVIFPGEINILNSMDMFQSYGLVVLTSESNTERKYNFKDQELTIPAGTAMGRMFFNPYINESMKESNAHAILCAERGMDNFFNLLDDKAEKKEGEMKSPEYLYGITGEKMANFSTRMGFEIVEKDEKNNICFLISKTDVVRGEFRKYQESMDPKLRQRLYDEAEKANPEFWNNPPDSVNTESLMVPNLEAINQIIMEINRSNSVGPKEFPRIILVGGTAGLCLGQAFTGAINQDYLRVAIGCGGAVSIYGLDMYLRKRSKKRDL